MSRLNGRASAKHLRRLQESGEKTAREIKSCLSKISYDTKFEAEVRAARYGQRAYKCDYCAHWHLASRKK